MAMLIFNAKTLVRVATLGVMLFALSDATFQTPHLAKV